MSETGELLSKEEICTVFERFKAQNPHPTSELFAPNPYCFLVSVVLSAQATDKSVNAATKELYKRIQTPSQMVALGTEGLIPYIKSVGLFRTKAEHIIALSKKLISNFDSTVPETMEDLLTLPGVGRKTANVVLNVIYGKKTMPVDTHLLRICPKIGLAKGSTPLEVETSLLERVPDTYMEHAHHWLILHGRYTCTAKKPQCGACLIADLCKANHAKGFSSL